jgi:hypothetical protein
MKKPSQIDPRAELFKDILADNPRLILEFLPKEIIPEGDREGISITVERVNLEELNRETISFPYQQNDPLLRFIREQPELLLKLLRDELHIKLPAYSKVKVEEQDLDHLVPQAPTHTVLLCQVRGKTVYGIALDVLRQVQEKKTCRWPLNTVLLHNRIETLTSLVVVAAGAEVEAFAKTPNYWQGEDLPPFSPIVIGPSLFITDRKESAVKDPARAAFAALLGPLNACG